MAINIDDLLAYARAQLGKPYVWAAAGPDSYDCSGLVQAVYHRFGINLPRVTYDQAKVGTEVPKTQIQAGDLVFSNWGSGPNSHVGLATGPSQIINAPEPGQNVQYAQLTPGYLSHVTAVRRVADGPSGVLASIGQIAGGIRQASIFDPIMEPIRDIAAAATSGKRFADTAIKVFAPSNAIRVAAGMSGAVFIVLGILLLAREVKPQ